MSENSQSLTPIQLFVRRVDIQGPDECWNWTGPKRSHEGYGAFSVKNHLHRAHRWLFQQFHPVTLKSNEHVCHSCDNPSCVNPNHLFLGNNSINQRDSVAKKRQKHARQTHCINGHPFSGDNLHIAPNGGRKCRACASVYNKRRYRKFKQKQAREAQDDD